jgi:hypothetical protein
MTTEPREASWSAPALWRFVWKGENLMTGCTPVFSLDARTFSP